VTGHFADRGAPLGGIRNRQVEHRRRVREAGQVRLERLQLAAAEADRLEDAVAARGGQIEHAELWRGDVGRVVAGGGAVV
jgi:hypothetical protein